MKFKYEAINRTGQTQRGLVEAMNKRSAIEVLLKNDLKIVGLQERKEIPVVAEILKLWEGVKPKEFVMFCRQLAVLIEAKVPLFSALQSIATQTNNGYFALVVKEVIADIDGGMSFSDALGKHPEVFSKMYVNMVKAGEASGNLSKSLIDLADNTEKNYELTSKLKGAMYYPAFILMAMILVGFAMMSFVMPTLLEMLKESNADLPLQTDILIAISDFSAKYWWALLIVIVGGIAGLSYYVNTDEGKREWDHVVLKIPIVNKILNNIYIARFAENLSTMVASGLPITTALQITADVVGNDAYRTIIRAAAEEIKKGGSMSEIFNRYALIPPIVVQMIHIGESTGRIDYSLGKVTQFYTREADQMVKNFTTLIEPVIMVILAIGVGVLVSAVLLPIYQVATSIK